MSLAALTEGVEVDGRTMRREESGLMPTSRRHQMVNRLHQVAMGIEEGKAMALCEVLPDEVRDEGRLTRARLPKDVEVTKAVFGEEAEGPRCATKAGRAEDEVRRRSVAA
jgi:hypothetical protein